MMVRGILLRFLICVFCIIFLCGLMQSFTRSDVVIGKWDSQIVKGYVIAFNKFYMDWHLNPDKYDFDIPFVFISDNSNKVISDNTFAQFFNSDIWSLMDSNYLYIMDNWPNRPELAFYNLLYNDSNPYWQAFMSSEFAVPLEAVYNTYIEHTGWFSFSSFLNSFDTMPSFNDNYVIKTAIPSVSQAVNDVQNWTDQLGVIKSVVLVFLYIAEAIVYVLGFLWWDVEFVIWLFGYLGFVVG